MMDDLLKQAPLVAIVMLVVGQVVKMVFDGVKSLQDRKERQQVSVPPPQHHCASHEAMAVNYAVIMSKLDNILETLKNNRNDQEQLFDRMRMAEERISLLEKEIK